MNSIIALLLLAILNGIHFSSTSHKTRQKLLLSHMCTCCSGCHGRNGRDGRDGMSGLPGRDGSKGSKGMKGEPGKKGEAGRDGSKGSKGMKGQNGNKGEPGRDGLKGSKGMNGQEGKRGEPGYNGTCDQSSLDSAVRKLTAMIDSFNQTFNKQILALDERMIKLENKSVCLLPRPLGMNSYAIKDSQISASSIYKDNPSKYGAHRARLNYKDWKGWAAKVLDTNQWLQVSFGNKTTFVTGVATQGYFDTGIQEYVKTYQISFSMDGQTWSLYKENGFVKTFTGNSDISTVVKHSLLEPVKTKFLRILPKTWLKHISMRMEVYGCH